MHQKQTLSLPLSVFMALLTVVCWSVAPVLCRFVRDYFSVSFQNLFRFAVSLVVLWTFTLARIKPGGVRPALSRLSLPGLKFIGLAVCIFLHQMFYIAGIYNLYPALASLLGESNVVYTILFAYIMFRDERSTIRNIGFLIGLAFALIGMVIVILSGARGEAGEAHIGVLYIILSALAWSLHSIFLKKWLSDVPVTLATAIIFSIDTILFALYILILQRGMPAPGIPLRAWIVLALSGILGIGAGYTFYFTAIPGIGVTVASSLGLLIPLVTAVFSYMILGELLTVIQAVGGAVLIAGCYLIIRTKSVNKR